MSNSSTPTPPPETSTKRGRGRPAVFSESILNQVSVGADFDTRRAKQNYTYAIVAMMNLREHGQPWVQRFLGTGRRSWRPGIVLETLGRIMQHDSLALALKLAEACPDGTARQQAAWLKAEVRATADRVAHDFLSQQGG
ncbi:MAG: hypothetical protein ABUL60_29735 [Myxococcales bacterium]